MLAALDKRAGEVRLSLFAFGDGAPVPEGVWTRYPHGAPSGLGQSQGRRERRRAGVSGEADEEERGLAPPA